MDGSVMLNSMVLLYARIWLSPTDLHRPENSLPVLYSENPSV